MKEVDSTSVQISVKHLADAFDRFFKKQNERPRFKSKRHPVQSYKTNIQGKNQLPESLDWMQQAQTSKAEMGTFRLFETHHRPYLERHDPTQRFRKIFRLPARRAGNKRAAEDRFICRRRRRTQELRHPIGRHGL